MIRGGYEYTPVIYGATLENSHRVVTSEFLEVTPYPVHAYLRRVNTTKYLEIF